MSPVDEVTQLNPTMEMIRRAYTDASRLLEGHRGPLESVGRDGYLALVSQTVVELVGYSGQPEDH